MGVIWGIPYLLIRVAVREISPETLVFARTSLAALILAPVAARHGQWRALISKWRWVLAFTVAEVAGPWLLLSDAERRLSSSLSGLLIAAVPIVGAVIALAIGREERLGPVRICGLVLGLGGVALLLGFSGSGASPRPVLEVGGVVLGYAIGPLIVSSRLRDLSSLGVVTASLAIAAVVYAVPGILAAPAHMPGARPLAAIAALAVVCTAVAFLLFFPLIGEIGPVRSTVITYVNPAVAVVLGVVFLHEAFSLETAIGFVLILIGSVLATRTRGATPTAVPEAGAAALAENSGPSHGRGSRTAGCR